MPMLLGTKGDDILKWRASSELVAALEEKLARRWEHLSSGEAESFLETYLGALGEELRYESQLKSELEVLTRGIHEALGAREILPLKARYLEVVSAHFRRRRSVLALCSLCDDLHDRLLGKAVLLAAARMQQLGQGKAPAFALLVSGDRGRGEQTLTGENRYFLVHEEPPARFTLFRRQFATVLQELGLPGGDRTLWHGGLKQWHGFVGGDHLAGDSHQPEDFLAPFPPLAEAQPGEGREAPAEEWETVALADLALVQGDPGLAARALAAASRVLQGERYRDPFLRLARQVVGMPLALGRFGRWRLERGGPRKGELSLKRYALSPLILALKVLALHAGVQVSGSVERIHRLLEVGALDVDLAERLLKAYQLLVQLRVLIEIRGDDGELFLNPEEFSEETEARFRAALDALSGLQKIGYQRLVGLG